METPQDRFYHLFGPDGADEGRPSLRRPNFAFVDADNIARGYRDALQRADIDEEDRYWLQISRFLAAGRHDRIFLYSAGRSGSEAAAWLKELERHSGFVLRLSRLTDKKQEGVDVKMAIDAIQHAYRSTMRSCCIYSGDGDFIPLIDALSDMGVFVTVAAFANPDKGSVAPLLREKADRYVFLGGGELYARAVRGKADWSPLEPYGGDFSALPDSYFQKREEVRIGDVVVDAHIATFTSLREAILWLKLALPHEDGFFDYYWRNLPDEDMA